MRILAQLTARADATYDHCYHHKLRGRIWRALEETQFDDRHDSKTIPGFTFSNPFPPSDLTKGDKRTLLIASPVEELLANVARELKTERELNIGEMSFRIHDLTVLNPDVGEPGTTGIVETGTGVLIRIPPWRFDEYGIDQNGDSTAFWRPEYTVKPFRRQIESNLDKKHRLFTPDHLPGPSDRDHELFDSYELLKTFALPVTVTREIELIHILSKWRFGYTVRDDHHRRHLNLLLDTGIGERNSLGLGFVNIVDKERPDRVLGSEADAFA